MPDHYRFAHGEVRPAARQLLIDGAPAALGARAFDLLVALIERRERVVDKAELFDVVWPGLVVEENNLQVQVSSLRKLLGPNVIATVSGRGYRFVAELAVDAAPGIVLPAAAARPNNLPRSKTRFIGREKALADCEGLLRTTRLLTLSGVGGCGKTRLAQELAQRQLDLFRDGVWFVDLAPLGDAERVPGAIAATLGLHDVTTTPLERITGHLREHEALVVLDNCEHVIDATAESVEALLSRCAALKVVTTSREALGMKGEQIYAVRSLSLPETTGLDEMNRSEAVRLFVDHARLVLPDFAVDDRNAAAIAEICRRLDGIALAIELAAARVRVLSVEGIRTRLDDRFRLLSGGNRALPRHQTLHATMQWSHDHLTAPEQRLFRRLAAFAGGCTLASAADIMGDAAPEHETLELLTALHDKSLLLVDRDTQAQPRYRMLETVRQYAQERLTEAGEGDAVRTRYLLQYVALAELAASGMNGPRQAEWFATLVQEQENLLAAHAWCALAPNGGACAVRLIALLWRHWYVTSQHATGYGLARAALGLAGNGMPSSDGATALLALSGFALRLGRYDDALESAERSLEAGRALNDSHLVAGALDERGAALHALGRAAEAIASHEEAYAVAGAAGATRLMGIALNGLGEIHREAGNFAEAQAAYEKAIALARTADNAMTTIVMLSNLVCVHIETGEVERAHEVFAECLAAARVVGSSVMCSALGLGATLASAAGSHSTAARLHGAAQARFTETGTRLQPLDAAFMARWMARSREAIGADAFVAGEAAGAALGYAAALADLERWVHAAA